MFHFLDAWESFLAKASLFLPGQETPTNCQGKNLLILPTLHAGKAFYSKVRSNLEAQGFSVAILSTLREPSSLDIAVEHIAKQIETADEHATLLAHGTGGLYALVLPDSAKKKIRRLITLGTPFQGSRKFHLSGYSYWDYGSEWIKQNAKHALFFPLFQPLSAIQDFTYEPQDSTSFGQGRDLWLDIPGNYNLVTRTENLRTIQEFLGSPKPETSTSKVNHNVKKYTLDLSRFSPQKKMPVPSKKKTGTAKKKSPAKKKKKP